MPIPDIRPYVKDNTKRHVYYSESIKLYNELKNPYLKILDRELIDKARPSESEEIKKYRVSIFKSKTHAPLLKVLSSLGKIRKSQDYMISFEGERPSKVAENESLENYTTVDFPKYGSLDNWFWSVCFTPMMLDANAVALVLPINIDKQDNEYFKPYPIVFHCDQVWDYKEGEFYVLYSNEKVSFTTNGRTETNGMVLYYVDDTTAYRYEQVDRNFNFRVIEFPHNLGYLPVINLRGVVVSDTNGNTLSRSRLSPIVPEFQEADREYSDLQLEVVQHVHSRSWSYDAQDCTSCSGSGKVPKAGKGPIKCPDCKGSGIVANNPMTHIRIKPPAVGEGNAPIPPGGYLEKSIDIAKLQDQRVQDHVYYGLAAINFEFTAVVPLSQSGVAKETDRAELNNFVYNVAEDCVRVIDEAFLLTNDLRTGGLIPDKEVRDLQLPNIPVPEKYDMLPVDYLSAEIGRLITGKASPLIIAAANTDYVSKRFNTDTELRDIVKACFELDPLSGRDEAELTVSLSNGGISKENYIIHSNIKEYIEMAIEEDESFLSLPKSKQREKLKSYTADLMKETSAKEKLMQKLNSPPFDASDNVQ